MRFARGESSQRALVALALRVVARERDHPRRSLAQTTARVLYFKVQLTNHSIETPMASPDHESEAKSVEDEEFWHGDECSYRGGS